MSQSKICPKCQALATLSAAVCSSCGHGYRTQFVPPVDTTQIYIPPALPPTHFQHHMATRQKRPLMTALVISVPVFCLLVVLGTAVSKMSASNMSSNMSVRPSHLPPYREFNGGIVRLSDSQAENFHVGEYAADVDTVMRPDYIDHPNEPNPHGIETWCYNLPNHHRLAILVGDGVVRVINAYDENGDNIRNESDAQWFDTFNR